MSRRIFRDVEEAISREVRRITFNDSRTADEVILKDTFDPFTGQLVSVPIEPRFYDSSADARQIQYPHFFVKFLKTREDRFSGRVTPPYGFVYTSPVLTSPAGYDIIFNGPDGSILALGNEFKTASIKIRNAQPGFLLRLLGGNNKGTYQIDHISVSGSGPSSIFVSSNIVLNLPEAVFSVSSRVLTFESPVDLNTVLVGDNFVDSTSTTFSITHIDVPTSSITLGGVTTPNLSANSSITRTGNVFQVIDTSAINYIVMDPSKPVLITTANGVEQAHDQTTGSSPQIPLDAYYLVRIDSKERDTHIDVLNRIWEEFNPPRTGIPVVIRSRNSADQAFTQDVPTGGSSIIYVKDNSQFSLNDPVFIVNEFHPTKKLDHTFDEPFESIVIAKVSNNGLQLKDVVPDTYTVANNSRIVSNCTFSILMFHFVDHITKDVEGSQYWVNEFTFWVQIWVDRLEDPRVESDIHDLSIEVEDL